MLRKEKEARLERYGTVAAEAGFAILVDPSGVDVRLMDEIRGRLADQGASAVRLKNTLARIVFERAGLEAMCEFLVGPLLLIHGPEDVGSAARLIAQYQHDFRDRILEVKGLWFGGTAYPARDFKRFTDLPTKAEARTRLVCVLLEPARRLARLAADTRARLVRVMAAHAERGTN